MERDFVTHGNPALPTPGSSLGVGREWFCPFDGSRAPIEVKQPACPKCGRPMLVGVKS